MTLLEMLDVLEAGCISLHQRSNELVAALGEARTHVTPTAVETPKRLPAKRKRKAAKGRRSKSTPKSQLALPMAAGAGEGIAVSEDASKSEEGLKRGKRQALGMSFSKLRASIQARRAGQQQREEQPAPEQSS